jgi:hypothetical protein
MPKGRNKRLEVEVGTGNVFADLGFPDADELNFKVPLAVEVTWLIETLRLPLAAAAVRECVWTLAAVFVIFGAAIIVSFAQMDRDAIMSRLSGTDAGKLDWSFYFRVVSFGGLPLLALLASQFPSFGRSLFSWLEPALNALH